MDPTFQVISMLAPFSIAKESPGILASVPVSYKSKVGGKGFRFNSRLQSILVKKSKHQELGSSHSQWSRERMSASVLGLSSPLYSPRPKSWESTLSSHRCSGLLTSVNVIKPSPQMCPQPSRPGQFLTEAFCQVVLDSVKLTPGEVPPPRYA